MKHHWAIVPAFALGLTVSASAQKSQDAVIVDPKVHNVLFENDHVRVFEARASYPASSAMQTTTVGNSWARRSRRRHAISSSASSHNAALARTARMAFHARTGSRAVSATRGNTHSNPKSFGRIVE